MKLCKKLVLCLLAVAVVLLCFVAFPPEVKAARSGDLTLEMNDEGTGFVVTDCDSDASGSLSIPSYYNGRPVVGIDDGAFGWCQKLTSITIPNTVTTIGNQAFAWCAELKSVSIPNGITSIGTEAFYECGNLDYKIYDNAMYLGSSGNPYFALVGVTSKDITACRVHSNTKVIAGQVFQYCRSLTEIILPDGLVGIGIWAFDECISLTSVTIPNSVRIIGDWSFYLCTGLTEITIGSGVTSFGEQAFADCSGLTSVTLQNGIKDIGHWAFSGCTSLKSVTIPDSVVAIGTRAFYGSGLSSITIGDGVTTIGTEAFAWCADLSSVAIGKKVSSIGVDAFYECSNLKDVYIDDLKAWCKIAFENQFSNPLHYGANMHLNGEPMTELVIPSGITAIPDYQFDGCTSLTSLTIPNGVTSVGVSAFRGCTGLSSITLPNSLKIVGEDAFLDCSGLKGVYVSDIMVWCGIGFKNGHSNPLYYAEKLYLNGEPVTHLVIPNSITSIPKLAFYGYTGMTGMTIPNNIKTIGDRAFYGCAGLTEISIPDSVTAINSWAFARCTGLTDLTIPDNGITLGNDAFSYCTGLQSLTIPDNPILSRTGSFVGCQIEKLVIAEGTEKITSSLIVCEKTLQEIVIPASVATIDPQVLSVCINLKSFQVDKENPTYYSAGSCLIETDSKTLVSGCATSQIPTDGSITSIGDYAFSGRANMTEITIPNGITAIGNYAFKACTGLSEITIPSSVVTIGDYAFSDCTGLTAFAIPDSVTTVGEYLLDGCTGLTSGSIGNGVTNIGSYMFKGCTGLTSITIPDGVTGIGGGAFYGCTGLTEIAIPDGVTSIGASAFCECTGLTQMIIPDGVTSIGGNAFYRCTGLTEVTIPDSVTTIGGWAFDSCKNLTSITLPSKLTSIKDNTFRQCESLTSINIPDSVEAIGQYAFAHCYKLNGITLPGSVTTIGDRAFYQCSRLTSLNIPEGVTTIGEYAFEECGSLVGSLILPNSVTSIGSFAFRGCKGLTYLFIGNGITVIPGNAFSGCTGLADISIPDSVTTISRSAFAYCTGLTSVIIPDGVTSIDGYAFNNCSGLTTLAIPASVTSIGTYAFDECNLRTVIFCGTQAQWGAIQKGYNCIPVSKDKLQLHNYENGVCTVCRYCDVSSILSYTINSTGNGYIVTGCYKTVNVALEIPESYNGKPVMGIGENAFADCANLTGITIGQNITAIGKNAFAGCTSLAEVFYKGTQEQWAAMAIDGENQVLRSALFHYSCTDAKNHWQVKGVKPTCTEVGYQYETCSCGHERNKVAGDAATGHSWVEANCAAPKTCSVCQATEGSANIDTHILGQWETIKTATPVASGERKRTCPCGGSIETEEIPYVGNGIVLTGELAEETVVYIDGLPYEVKADGEGWYVELPSAKELLLVTYTYHEGDGQDVHTQYPTGMKVYLVKDGKITHIPELDNLLQYSGASIRITGKKGIRMITSIEKAKKTALTGKGLAGYTLVEYGTTLCFANEIPEGDALVLDRSYARSNYAYKKGVADPVFATTKDLVQYTNVLVGFSLDQCKDDIAMRPYIILKNAEGEQFTIYGGTIYRSIGYIAYQNRTVFQPKTGSYNYVWEIIHHVYGDKYDADYKG